jgi:predicted nucleic acid-binding protein
VNVFIDTNIIIDLLAKREPFYLESLQLFSLADSKQIDLTVSGLSLINTHYILNDVMKLKDARSIIGKFKVLVESHALNDKIIDLALNDLDFKDFEDGIQYYTALESQASSIITRNLKDFKHSIIPVMSPKEFLAKRKSER